MGKIIEKVTAFVTRPAKDGYQLLLIEHPNAGIQIPAGTVESNESPQEAVIRETFEETGLSISSPIVYLGLEETQLLPDEAIILPPVTIFARPDTTSFDWICIRSAVQVKVLRWDNGFTQITYIEYDQVPKANFITLQITGWILDENLAQIRKRHFFHLQVRGDTEPHWQIFSDHHTFNLFWAPVNELPCIIPPQDSWLKFLPTIFEE